MSGECERCGEHALDCDCANGNRTAWISVKDRLPETDQMVLFFDKENICYGEYEFYNPGDRWYDVDRSRWRIDVSHWMPLPDPPVDE